jgi:hypothetical protein
MLPIAMRQIDAILNSNPFWGIVSFLFLVIGGWWKQDTVKALALFLGWVVGLYVIYGACWRSQAVQDWRLLGGSALLYTGIVFLLYYGFDPHRSVSRPISGEPVGRGKFITAVSHLNVGASPVEMTHVPNPPDWRKPTTRMRLVFQDSPLLTNAIQQQITEDLSAFREYLLGLEIPVPDEFPPIGVSNVPGSAQSRTWGSLPTYRSGATINQGWVLDRRAITEQYASFVIEEMLRRSTEQHPGPGGTQDLIAGSALSQYYNWSFWDYKAENTGGHWSSQLWEIRRAMGKQFTDRLVGFTLRSMLDNPEEGADPNFDLYFYRKIQVADSIIDNNAEKMPEITRTIERSGINVTEPKATLEFAATAVKRHDGSFVVDVTVVNKADIPIGKGQISLYFAPDVNLVREPRGSEKDASRTTLRSYRVFNFESITAHETKKMRLELKPISNSFSSDPIIHFDYVCEGCARDTYSHDLRLKLKDL